MDIIKGSGFVKSAGLLPHEIKIKLTRAIEILALDPYDPFLRTKKLSGEFDGKFSFRVGHDWRVIFYFIGSDTLYLQEVAHRKDIYR